MPAESPCGSTLLAATPYSQSPRPPSLSILAEERQPLSSAISVAAVTETPSSQPAPLPVLYRAAEVCDMFSITPRTLRRWEVQGILLPIRVNRSVFYRIEDINSLFVANMSFRFSSKKHPNSTDISAIKNAIDE